jgi:probable addiction module antidote protein
MIKKSIVKQRKHEEFREYVLKKLQDPKLALAYLNEALVDEDQRVFLLTLKNVLEAQGGDMTTIAEEANVSRQNLYRILSKQGNPKLTSIRSVLHVLGLELAVQLHKSK